MNMQISPTSTHSHQLRDPLDNLDVIGYKVVSQKHQDSRLSLIHCSFKESDLRISTWFVLNRIKTPDI